MSENEGREKRKEERGRERKKKGGRIRAEVSQLVSVCVVVVREGAER